MARSKLEKSISECHREYLDLDTDEEEFGKQETPEPEDEADLEPEKPSFSKEELKILVRQVKDMTTLPYLTTKSWNEKCENTICTYFCEPANPILTIFFEGNILKSLLGFPRKTDSGMVYFLRNPWQIYNVANFMSTVIFGSVHSKIERTILSSLEYIFSPIAFDSEEWLQTSKYDVFENLHKLIGCLTNIVYSPMGYTVLYVPSKSKELEFTYETGNLDSLDDLTQKMGRMERLSRIWIIQLQISICDSFYANDKYENSIEDELNVWMHKRMNFEQILQQLSNENIVLILKKLQEENAQSAKEVHRLEKEIKNSLLDAKSNLNHVKSLLEMSQKIEKPSDIEGHASEVLRHIKFVSQRSTYYELINGVEKLCRAFSMHVIQICRNHVDMNVLFDKGTVEARQVLEGCIASCQSYRKCYDQTAIEETSWTGIRHNVFKYVTIFEERCQDVINICNTMAIFPKVDQVCPLASGPKAKCNELRFRELNSSFCDSLLKISKAFTFALDVTNVQWYRCFQKFKQDVDKVLHKIELLVNEVFREDVHNASDSIDMIHTMLEFKHSSFLKSVLLKVWVKTWKLYVKELRKRTNISGIQIGDIPSEDELKKFCIGKSYIVISLSARMAELDTLLRDYCEIDIEDVKNIGKTVRKVSEP